MNYSEYIGKYVHYTMPDGSLIGGIVDSYGPNKFFPDTGIWITIDRCPFRDVDTSKIIIKPLPISWEGSMKKHETDI